MHRLLLLVVLAATSASATNLLPNPSFEDASCSPWYFPDDGNGGCSGCAVGAKSGKNCLWFHLEDISGHWQGYIANTGFVIPKAATSCTKSCSFYIPETLPSNTVTIWFSEGQATSSLGGYKGRGTTFDGAWNSVTGTDSAPTNQWFKVTDTMATQSRSGFAQFQIWFNFFINNPSGSTIYVDDCSVVCATSTVPTPTPIPVPTPKPVPPPPLVNVCKINANALSSIAGVHDFTASWPLVSAGSGCIGATGFVLQTCTGSACMSMTDISFSGTYKFNSSHPWFRVNGRCGSGGCSTFVQGLVPATTYRWRVACHAAYGIVSYSPRVTVTTLPLPVPTPIPTPKPTPTPLPTPVPTPTLAPTPFAGTVCPYAPFVTSDIASQTASSIAINLRAGSSAGCTSGTAAVAQFKPASATTWQNVARVRLNQIQLTGLSPSTMYNIRFAAVYMAKRSSWRTCAVSTTA